MRVGRNDPCYCGSGKKYKRCCLSAPQSRDTAYATHHPETDVEILDRAIPPLVIHEVMAEVDGWSLDDFQRLVDDLMKKHPALLAFVVSVIAVMPTTIREHSLL